MTNVTETKTAQKTSIWTEGILSVLGRPVQVWKDSMKHAAQMANEKTKSIPGGVVDRPDLSTGEKISLLLPAGFGAALGATGGALISLPIVGILGITAALSKAAVLGTAVASVGAVGALVFSGMIAAASITTREEPKAGVLSAIVAAVTTGITGLTVGFTLGLGVTSTVGLGMAGFGLVAAPRSISKALYLTPKSVTSILDAAMLGLPSGAAQSMRAVVKSVKSVIKRKPKPVANNNQAQNCPTCVQTQQQVSDLTQKVQGLEKQFAQSGAKPKSRRTRPTAKKTSSRTVKKST